MEWWPVRPSPGPWCRNTRHRDPSTSVWFQGDGVQLFLARCSADGHRCAQVGVDTTSAAGLTSHRPSATPAVRPWSITTSPLRFVDHLAALRGMPSLASGIPARPPGVMHAKAFSDEYKVDIDVTLTDHRREQRVERQREPQARIAYPAAAWAETDGRPASSRFGVLIYQQLVHRLLPRLVAKTNTRLAVCRKRDSLWHRRGQALHLGPSRNRPALR